MSDAVSVIETSVRNRVLVIRFNRPGKHNALTAEMVASARSLVDGASGAGYRAVVITGAGASFAAGADIHEYSTASPQTFSELISGGSGLCDAIQASPVPVIAAVNGLALGGGCEIVLSCDMVVAAPRAQLGLPEVGIGLIPGWGGTQRLVDAVGPYRARHLVMTGTRLTAEAAHGLGIVSAISDDCLADALTLADSLVTASSDALSAVKSAVNARITSDVGFAVEAAGVRRLFDSHSGSEGIQAFVEKRAPRFEPA